MQRLCRCGVDLDGYSLHLRECYRCRVTSLEPKACADCGATHHRRTSKCCEPCSRARWLFSNHGSGRSIAGFVVARARRMKQLPSPRGFACCDCGAPAVCYDHRDYGEPLRVDPVCHGCNIRRRSALPKRWTFAEFMSWFNTSRVSRNRVLSPDVLQRLERNHFNGPGGLASRVLRTTAAA